MLFRSPMSLLALSAVKRGTLKLPTMIVRWSTSPFSSAEFCSVDFETLLLDT